MRSNKILKHIINDFIKLMQRMEHQVNGFEIWAFLENADSYTYINIDENLSSKNEMVNSLLNSNILKR